MRALYSAAVAAVMAAATLAAPAASAHAVLKNSSPAAGANLPAAPKQIALTFNEKVEQAFSSVAIVDSQGKDVTTEKAQVDATDPALVRLNLPTLPAGTYTVKWAVAGHDGHRRKGDFKFAVK